MSEQATNFWFGTEPWGQICKSIPRVDTPVGEDCLYCWEPIQEGDSGEMIPVYEVGLRPIHRECLLRLALGSVGHQQRRCSCYGGEEEDPPGLTKRQAALAACEFFGRRPQ